VFVETISSDTAKGGQGRTEGRLIETAAKK
jgi:hypothetical protein